MPEASVPSFPLKSWRLRGFRSLRDETSFELGGLNVLVGANSAGKSSMLHSLLMVAQTLGNPLADRPLVLNGPLVRLGLAEDTVHVESRGSVSVGFGLQATSANRFGLWRGDFGCLEIDATFQITGSGEFGLRTTTVAADQPESESEAERQSVTIAARTQTAAEASYRAAGLTRAQAREAARRGTFSAEGTLPDRTGGATARQFLPDLLWTVVNEYEVELESFAPYRWDYRRRRPPVPRRADEVVSPPTVAFIKRYLTENDEAALASQIPRKGGLTTVDLANAVGPRGWEKLQELALARWYAVNKGSLPFRGTIEQLELPSAIAAGIEYGRSWFQGAVRHLGPLRAAPQPLYGLPEAASGTSVGRNGEYTASVLSAHARRPVISPDPVTGNVREVTLGQAVDEWMGAMELLSSVRSLERGKLGYELQVSVEGVTRALDLTTVGVGVSQALPVVVLGLINGPGTLLLFEQPELHLHPDVQAALGDFFLALARSGRQIIVETHSEYLINRLRRRAAATPEALVPALVRLLFFERSGSTATVTPARIGAGGGMPGWPRGFLDTAAREIRAMAEAARGHG